MSLPPPPPVPDKPCQSVSSQVLDRHFTEIPCLFQYLLILYVAGVSLTFKLGINAVGGERARMNYMVLVVVISRLKSSTERRGGLRH